MTWFPDLDSPRQPIPNKPEVHIFKDKGGHQKTNKDTTI